MYSRPTSLKDVIYILAPLPLWILGQTSHAALNPQLDGSLQLIGLDLLVGDLALLVDPSVANLAVLLADGACLGMAPLLLPLFRPV